MTSLYAYDKFLTTYFDLINHSLTTAILQKVEGTSVLTVKLRIYTSL